MSPEFRGALALRVCSTTRYQLFRRAGASGPMPGVKPASRPCVKKGRCRSRLSVLPSGWSSMTEFRRDRDVDLAGSFQHVGLPHHIQFACDCGQPIAGTLAASLSNQALIVNERRQTALQSSMRQGHRQRARDASEPPSGNWAAAQRTASTSLLEICFGMKVFCGAMMISAPNKTLMAQKLVIASF